MQIVFLTGAHRPSEDILIELHGAHGIGRREIRPAETGVLLFDAETGVVLRLPYGEYGAGGIGNGGHAAVIHDVEG